MRIQETDRILKEARVARNSHGGSMQAHEDEGMMSRVWKSVSHLPTRLTEMMRRSR